MVCPDLHPPLSGDRLRQRALILRTIRRFFERLNFTEIEAPILVTSPGMEPHLDAFELETTAPRRYLHTSPEYALKRVLGMGFRRIFSLTPCFRDEHPSRTHSPEFTMLEWYQVGIDLHQLMDTTETLITTCAAAMALSTVRRRGIEVRLDAPFERLTVRGAFQRHAGIDPWLHTTADTLRDAARAVGLVVHTDSACWDDVFFQIFLNVVEPALGVGRPTFLWGWPRSQAALSRLDPDDPTTALRFELFAGGLELANAFDELTDPVEQRQRFEVEQAERAGLNKSVYPIDEALLFALGRMSPTCGIALGIDRLVMLLTGASDIADVRVQPW